MENAIEIVHVTKKFKETVAVNGVTVSLERGKIHGIIGRNGSGKTVLFKCICGLFPVTEGEITVLGQKMGDGKRVPKGVGAIIETPGFLPNCSGYQNLRYLMELSGKADKERIRGAISQVGLFERLRELALGDVRAALRDVPSIGHVGNIVLRPAVEKAHIQRVAEHIAVLDRAWLPAVPESDGNSLRPCVRVCRAVMPCDVGIQPSLVTGLGDGSGLLLVRHKTAPSESLRAGLNSFPAEYPL